MEKTQGFERRQVLLFMLVAYLFSFAIRMIWVYQFQDNPNFYWNGQLMINTNDGYFFASGAQKVLYGMHLDNPRIPDMWSFGTVALTVLLTKVTPFSLETVILYMPAIISSLVVIPIILIARLYKGSLWGFFAALLGSIAWSYYNRTMTGYYDTDMFSAMAPMFILYFLMKSTIDFNLKSALYAALAIAVYPFLYDAGASIVYAMGTLYAVYMIIYHRNEDTTYNSIILVFLALVPFPLADPYSYIVKIAVLVVLYFILLKSSFEHKKSLFVIGILFLLFMYFGNVFGLILSKISFYTATGTTGAGLHFYGVTQTIREAGKIPFETFANRISGSQIGVILSLVGYIVLVIRHRAFILALPLVGIGVFALWGGLRFTVYAVPVAAMSVIYLFHIITTTVSDKKSIYLVGMTVLTASMLYPNIKHIIQYKVPTVLNKAEVQDLDALRKVSDSKDYVMAWWDYGYPIWFYSDTNTIIDGGKHQNDNFIISKIMQTTSPEVAANLSRLAVETYVSSGYKTIADTLFKNGQKEQLDPNLLLSELENDAYKLPKKTRNIYLYLPYRMLNIFPTVAVFGNLDLTTGKAERKIAFYPTNAVKNDNGVLQFSNGIVFDTKKGELFFGKQKVPVKYFIVTQMTKNGETQIQTQPYHAEGQYVVVFMKSYGRFMVMDEETFRSMYVQMFILGKYDKELFEPVVSSPYSRIYKLKR
ncbi:peptide-binding protein [Sulfurovum lithotrophicum]|uniref:Peptide-binding protein n=1 Tax=Sulfurovum lithotrophicum TaxID=206403 RepID=A0A7U4RPX1_9BACT|nr:STT3 domain-containing protein [Sulfurovum lithotrophicum]AKF24146.1 peptide-binding protein [Sulfurovum lithotrophicum]